MRISLMLYILCAFILLESAYCATKCYECETCSTPFNEKTATIKTCSTNPKYECRKIVSSGKGKPVISRSCVAPNVCTPGKKESFGIVTETTCCSADLCNQASYLKCSITVLPLLSYFIMSLIN